MLIVNKKQMDAFSRILLRDFEETTRKRIRKKLPEQSDEINDEAFHKLITDGIAKAESYDIIEKEDIKIYLEYMVYCSPDFDTNKNSAWAPKILKIRNLKGSEKIARMKQEHPIEEKKAEPEFEIVTE